MPQNKIKRWCDKQLKSSHKLFINTLFEDINNNPNLICIREINLNYIQEYHHFNASINPILTDKELEDKYKDKAKHEDEVKEVKQEIDHLKDV